MESERFSTAHLRTNTEFLFLTVKHKAVSFERIKSELRHPEKLKIEDWLVDSQPKNLPAVQPANYQECQNTYSIRAVLQEDVNR